MKSAETVSNKGIVHIDEKDKQILQHLSLNSRVSNTFLASKIGLSKDAIKYRIERLEREGILQGYTAILDIWKLGYSTQHLFLKIKSISKREEIIERIKSHPNVNAVLEFSGKYDLEVGIATKDSQDLDEVATEITKDQFQMYEIILISKIMFSRILPRTIVDAAGPAEEQPAAMHEVDKKDISILRELSV